LDRVDGSAIGLHVEDGFHRIASVPEYGLSLVIAGGKDAIMELIEAYFLYFFVVVVEVGKGSGLVALRLAGNVPDRQLPVVASSDYLSLLVGVPFERVPFSLVS
jgi:hypothetical protein